MPDPGKKLEIPLMVSVLALVVSALLGGLTIGFNIGKGQCADTKELLNKERDQAREERDQARQQAAAAKADSDRRARELLVCQASSGSKAPNGQLSAINDAAMKPPPGEAILRVYTNETGAVFNHQLYITVVGIQEAYSPFRYQASLKMGAPGVKSLSVSKADAGDRLAYESFEIRVISVDDLSAICQVRRSGAAATPPA